MTLSKSIPSDILYINQPLVEVASEVRFYGEPAVETKRDQFFEKIRDIYPLVYVPPIKEGTHPSLQHYRFEKEDLSAGVTLALNSIGYFQRQYEGATKYINEFVRVFEIANKIFNIRTYSRVGWRYINAIPYVRENSLIPLSRFFRNPPSFFAIEYSAYRIINFFATTSPHSHSKYLSTVIVISYTDLW